MVAATDTGVVMDEATVRAWLDEVPDPEIPVLTIMDLGVVRDVRVDGGTVELAITPTYSGCPATRVIEENVTEHLHARGVQTIRIKRVLSPAWTSAWLSADGRRKMRAYGIVPPDDSQQAGGRFPWSRATPQIQCPRCDADNVERVSEFGSTPCKAQFRCLSCLEPFEYFKCI